MKILSKLIILACLAIGALASCESPDLSDGRTGTDQSHGLLNVTIQIPDNPAEYTATKKGPYEEGEEITVKVPTTDDDPLDLTRLLCSVSLEHNCYVENPFKGETDFTEPVHVTVIDVNGDRHNNTIRILPTPPKTRFTKLWEKNAVDLGLPGRNITGLAMNAEGLNVQMYDDPIYRFDFKTGSFVKQIPSARSFMMKADVDDAGHLITARENIYGAGFMVFYYNEQTNEHQLLLDYENGAGCPEDMGYEFSVIGDVTSGKAYIYGMAPDVMTIYYWELNDGQLVTPADQPKTLRYGPAGGEWSRAQIQRASLEDNSDHYISFWSNSGADEDADPDEWTKGSRFQIFSPYMDVLQMNPKNHLYKILDFKVFTVHGDTFVAFIEQGYTAWSAVRVRVFEITNRNMIEMSPDDDGYDQFCLFNSDLIYPTNYNKWGDIAVFVEPTTTGYDVYIGATAVGYDTNESCIRMYKMNYYIQ